MSMSITLISHVLCPYVQRVAIALSEKGVAHDRVTIDLTDKPGWFLELTPLGRTPVLKVGDSALFESAAILEFLEDTLPQPLHPTDPIERARHRAWIGFASECLNEIAGLYSAPNAATLERKIASLHLRMRVVEDQLGPGPWFAEDRFSLVDAVFAPVFRYFDSFDRIGDLGVLDGLARVSEWRRALADRPSVRNAVAPDHQHRLAAFLRSKDNALSRMMKGCGAALGQSA